MSLRIIKERVREYLFTKKSSLTSDDYYYCHYYHQIDKFISNLDDKHSNIKAIKISKNVSYADTHIILKLVYDDIITNWNYTDIVSYNDSS